jgi:hypothetical protein
VRSVSVCCSALRLSRAGAAAGGSAQQAAAVRPNMPGKLTDAQIKTDVDAKKPFGLKKGELGGSSSPTRG